MGGNDPREYIAVAESLHGKLWKVFAGALVGAVLIKLGGRFIEGFIDGLNS